jgi:hypothetical protein
VSATLGTFPTHTAPCTRLVKYFASPGWANSRTYSVASWPPSRGVITSTASAAVSPVSQVKTLDARKG